MSIFNSRNDRTDSRPTRVSAPSGFSVGAGDPPLSFILLETSDVLLAENDDLLLLDS